MSGSVHKQTPKTRNTRQQQTHGLERPKPLKMIEKDKLEEGSSPTTPIDSSTPVNVGSDVQRSGSIKKGLKTTVMKKSQVTQKSPNPIQPKEVVEKPERTEQGVKPEITESLQENIEDDWQDSKTGKSGKHNQKRKNKKTQKRSKISKEHDTVLDESPVDVSAVDTTPISNTSDSKQNEEKESIETDETVKTQETVEKVPMEEPNNEKETLNNEVQESQIPPQVDEWQSTKSSKKKAKKSSTPAKTKTHKKHKKSATTSVTESSESHDEEVQTPVQPQLIPPQPTQEPLEVAETTDTQQEKDEDETQVGCILPMTTKSVTPHPLHMRYGIEEMKGLQIPNLQIKNAMVGVFERFARKEEDQCKKNKNFFIDRKTAIYRQAFNQLTDKTLVTVADMMVLQIRTREDLETMLSILFNNAINERKYVKLYVQFFIYIRSLMQRDPQKVAFSSDMIVILLDKAEHQFNNPPVPQLEVQGETPEQRVQREEKNNNEVFEYLGTVYLVSYLYTEKTVIPDLVLQCFDVLSKVKGTLPIKAFKTMVNETHDQLVKDGVGLEKVKNLIKEMLKREGLTFMEKVLLDTSLEVIEGKPLAKIESPHVNVVNVVDQIKKGEITSAKFIEEVAKKSASDIGLIIEGVMDVMDNGYSEDLEKVLLSADFIKKIGKSWNDVINTMKAFQMKERGGLELFGKLLGCLFIKKYIDLSVIIDKALQTKEEAISIVGKVKSPLFLLVIALNQILSSVSPRTVLNLLGKNSKNLNHLVSKNEDIVEVVYHSALVIASGSEDEVVEGNEEKTMKIGELFISITHPDIVSRVLNRVWVNCKEKKTLEVKKSIQLMNKKK
ncbi:hypothetical protein EIN_228390 [Entamoeba invadens IP1]|uniref:Uncharacterized protein n=1 Tax=Entamoeba invadens IP1 TaxID=370355 RepID=A0A0A1U2S9_ENTIV|nr:hypothetical protein EIN_228390 [Entamoeba invadens IP1]ELP88376.1 hypothetical protein EIN_228390 [Entamoeba invadens IP1]|eukprot:XP_004255147.1 hypothetical protein EIN_228390 [Entamoeba invadens IP1]